MQKSERSESDNVEEDSNEEINDVSLYSSSTESIEQTRNQSSRYDSSTVNALSKTKTVKNDDIVALVVGNSSFEATEQCRHNYLSKVEIVEQKLFESIEQGKDDWLSEVEIYYDDKIEVHGAIEWKIIESVKNKLELVECTEKCRPDYFSKAEIGEEKSLNSKEHDREDHLSRVENYYNTLDKINAIAKKKNDT